MRKYSWLLVFVCLLSLGLAMEAFAWPGTVVIKDGTLLWGQYKNLKNIVAVPKEPGKDLAESIRNYPINGVSAVLLPAQTPDVPFFTVDGSAITPECQQQMQHDLDIVNSLDMLPVVVLFDPEQKLANRDAYEKAAVLFKKTFGKENWFLLCLSDQCGHPAFGNGVKGCRAVADAVAKEDDKQLIAAGGSSVEQNKGLLADNSAIKVIVARTEKPGTATAGITAPAVEVLTAPKDEVVKELAGKAYGAGTGLILADAAKVAAELPILFDAVDTYQKTHYTAMPPDEANTFSLKPGEKEEGFVSLFNGKDLSGWIQITNPGEFIVENGVIKMVGRSSGWARSWKMYKDFVFRGEFKITDKGNNGFWFRTTPVGRNSRLGFELQIFGDPAQMTPTKESCGSIYDVRPPDAHLMKPEEWNDYEVTCRGDEITIKWNGQVVHHVTYNELEPMKNRTRQGFIGLTQHHAVVEYRNLRVKEL